MSGAAARTGKASKKEVKNVNNKVNRGLQKGKHEISENIGNWKFI